jgi:hypothetical protein
MPRYVLRYTGDGPKPAKDVDQVKAHPNVDILDDTSDKMLLVDAPPATIEGVTEGLAHWVVSPELTTDRPEPHPGAPRPTSAPD